MARSLGQLLPRHPELVRAAPGRGLRGRRPRRLHAPRRDRRPPRAIRRCFRGARPGGRRRPDDRSGAGRLRRPNVCRQPARRPRRPVHRRVPACPPPRRLRLVASRPAADRHRGLPKRGQPATGANLGRRQRAVGLPAGRGAARSRPRCRPLVREGPVGAAPAGWPRPRLVAGGVGLPRPAGRGPAVACGPPRREPPGDGPRRRPRPEPPDAPGDGGDARRPLPGGRRSPGAVRPRPRRHGGLGGRAVPRAHGTDPPGSRRARASATGDRRSWAVRRRSAGGSLARRVRGGRVRRRLPPGLPFVAALGRRVRRAGLPDPARRGEHGRRRPLLRRDPLPADPQVVDPARGRRGRRRSSRGRSQSGWPPTEEATPSPPERPGRGPRGPHPLWTPAARAPRPARRRGRPSPRRAGRRACSSWPRRCPGTSARGWP